MKVLVLGLLCFVLAGCASWDHHYTSAVAVRNQIGDQCNVLRDTWRADMAAEQPVSTIETDHQRMMMCVADFRRAQSDVEAAAAAHAAAVAQLGASLQSAASDMRVTATTYRQAAQSIQRPPPPAPLPPVPDLSDMYAHTPPPHGCLGLAPVPGPGLNPCPVP